MAVTQESISNILEIICFTPKIKGCVLYFLNLFVY